VPAPAVLAGPSFHSTMSPRPAPTYEREAPVELNDIIVPYAYQSIPSGQRMIRLLKIQPAIYRADAVICEVLVCPLDTAPKYAALSYCWGEGSDDRKILITTAGAGVFRARKSLEDALKRFRACKTLGHDKEDYIWADAICINQNDTKEKSEQLQMMQDIYSGANAVYVDLGEEDYSWNLVEDLIVKVCAAADLGPWAFMGLPLINHPAYRDYWHTFMRPWFTRSWVVQEIVLAKQAIAMLGRQQSFSWEYLDRSFNILRSTFISVSRQQPSWSLSQGGAILRCVLNYQSVCDIRKRVSKSENDSIRMLHLTRDFDVTDPKDKIFSLLSLFPEPERLLFSDYSISLCGVFTKFAKYHVEQGRALEILGYAGLQRQSGTVPDLPSWVPEWSYKDPLGITNHGPVGILSYGRIPYRAGRDPNGARSGTVLSDHSLLLRGDIKDTILMVQESPLANVQDPERQFDPKTGISEACSVLGACRHLCTKVYSCVEHAFAATLVCMEDWDSDDWSSTIMPWTGPRRSRYHPLEAYATFMVMSREELERPGHLRYDASVVIGYEYHHEFLVACAEQKFAVTEIGLMALVPSSTKIGDRVCIFSGATMPYILRPSVGGEGRYRLVGDTFVQGMMYGEIRMGIGTSTEDIYLV